ncbi:hypothetical protein BJV78DRAFT_161974 [Lactifluus subvellereus]|nr:hypothetical protein BJV78DRAFT_161974 [Lactifluus subvellereus]
MTEDRADNASRGLHREIVFSYTVPIHKSLWSILQTPSYVLGSHFLHHSTTSLKLGHSWDLGPGPSPDLKTNLKLRVAVCLSISLILAYNDVIVNARHHARVKKKMMSVTILMSPHYYKALLISGFKDIQHTGHHPRNPNCLAPRQLSLLITTEAWFRELLCATCPRNYEIRRSIQSQ